MREAVKNWIKKAEEDYRSAIHLLDASNPLPNSAGFHAQQCAEKYLKAFLVQNEIAPPRTHDLIRLNVLCIEKDPDFEKLYDNLDLINPFSVEFRYPGIDASLEEAEEAVEQIKFVRGFLRKKMGLD